MNRQPQEPQETEITSQPVIGQEIQAGNHAVQTPDSSSLPVTMLIRQAKRQQRLLMPIIVGPVSLFLLWTVLGSILWPAYSSEEANDPIRCTFLFGPPLALQMAAFVGLFVLGRQQKATMQQLAETADTRSIGPLLEIAASVNDPKIKAIPYESLMRLLPLLQEGDNLRLTDRQYRSLAYVLLYTRHSDLHLAILQALEKIGDRRAVKPVERLAKRGRTLAIREEAARILPILRGRQPLENAPATLLRASEPGMKALLRASEPGEKDASKELLRANIGDEDLEPRNASDSTHGSP